MNIDSLFHPNSFLPRLNPILCALCVASFLGLNMGGDNMTWDHAKIFGYLPPNSVWTGQPWSLISSTFVHFQVMHVLFNVLWLWVLGNVFEDNLGSLGWGAFFLLAAWTTSALQLLSGGDAGIGMSGVVYALFGFGWIARRRIPAFAIILNQQTMIIALVWLVACIFTTAAGITNIGNVAHLSGLAFGAAVAGVWFVTQKIRRALSGVGAAVLFAAAFVPLFWCPTSGDWTGIQAEKADKRHDYTTALYWYKRTASLDSDSSWALGQMARIYSQQGDLKNLNQTLQNLGEQQKKAEQAEEDSKEPQFRRRP